MQAFLNSFMSHPKLCVNLRCGVEQKHHDGGSYYDKKETYFGRNRAEGKNLRTAAGEQCKQVLGEKKSRKSFSDFLLGGATVRVAVIYFISV